MYNGFSMTSDDWKKKLTPEQYKILREKGTEAPFSGEYVYKYDKGIYRCAACGTELFSSDSKFESKEPGLKGWPSFDRLKNSQTVELRSDNSMGAPRTEVICKNCGSHLGHLFKASDSKTGEHYCINSCALDFKPS